MEGKLIWKYENKFFCYIIARVFMANKNDNFVCVFLDNWEARKEEMVGEIGAPATKIHWRLYCVCARTW